MPVLASAIKKLRQAKVAQERNRAVRLAIKKLRDGFRKKPTAGAFSKLASALDRAAKKNVIHKNRAARLKSRLAKLLK